MKIYREARSFDFGARKKIRPQPFYQASGVAKKMNDTTGTLYIHIRGVSFLLLEIGTMLFDRVQSLLRRSRLFMLHWEGTLYTFSARISSGNK